MKHSTECPCGCGQTETTVKFSMSPFGKELFDQATEDIKERVRLLKKPIITERINRPSERVEK